MTCVAVKSNCTQDGQLHSIIECAVRNNVSLNFDSFCIFAEQGLLACTMHIGKHIGTMQNWEDMKQLLQNAPGDANVMFTHFEKELVTTKK